MSCLTRKLQQKLARYVQKNGDSFNSQDPEAIRAELVNRGICPSDVTTDQLVLIMKDASS